MVNPTRVPVAGPLAEFRSGFASELLRQGYKTNPAGVQMNLMAHLSRWLAAEGLDVHRLSDTEVLPEIGQLLRHRRVLTTAIYAKVDRKALRTIARPWPGGVE